MRPGLVLGAAAAVGAAPSAVLLLLILTGAARPGPALLGLASSLIAALVLASLWARDVRKLQETLLHAGLDDHNPSASGLSGVDAPGPRAPILAPLDQVARGIERLARTLAERVGEVDRLSRANQAIVERLPDLLLILGEDGAVRRANAAARAGLGSDIAAVVRHPVLRGAIERAFARHGQPQTAELTLPVPIRRDMQATVLVMDPPLADGGHAIAVLSDRTRERAVERMRADFVTNASHELRTPLTSLIGFIETLRGPAADDVPAQRRFLGIMAEQAERMKRLIDDLLSLSRIELTEHLPPSERVDVGGVAARVAASFEPRLPARRASLELGVQPNLPPVIADADQLDQVMENLIENALKYGREGGRIGIEVATAHPGGRWPLRPGVLIAVRDDGPGIDRNHVPRLTERFYRVDKGRDRNAGGTGLGLAIVKHIVNRHRGQLVIESEEGRGSVFSIWLPQAPDA